MARRFRHWVQGQRHSGRASDHPGIGFSAARWLSRDAGLVAGYLATYVLLDWISYVYPTAPLGITPWNPPPGLSLFLLLRFGLRYWPALLAAAVAAELLVRGAAAGWISLVAGAAVITAGYTTAAHVLRDRIRLRLQLDSARDLASLVLVAAAATLAVAALFVGLHIALGVVGPEQFTANLVRFWIGDLDGILVLTPVLLVYATRVRPGTPSRPDLLEYVLQGAAMVASLWLFGLLASRYGFVFFSVLFLPMTWIAARHGLRGATLAVAFLQLGLIGLVQVQPNIGATFVQLQAATLALCITGLVLGAVVSHRVRVELDLRGKQTTLNNALRFAVAGETTSALAHELNQPITALSNYLGACQLLTRSGDPAALARLDETLGKASLEARRASEIIQRIREFFRQGVTRPRRVSALRVVQDAVAAAQSRTAALGIVVTVHDEGSADVYADPMQLESAVQNVLNNAIDAVGAAADAGRHVQIFIAPVPAGVEICVEDNGPGVSPEMAQRIFEPFNTDRADGMGLGLAITRTLLRANGGDIEADLSCRSGARFRLYVPVHPVPP